MGTIKEGTFYYIGIKRTYIFEVQGICPFNMLIAQQFWNICFHTDFCLKRKSYHFIAISEDEIWSLV